MGASYKIKLSPNLRPYVGRVVRGGWVQRAFKAQIGTPVGACVKGAVRKGMKQSDIRKAVKDCAPAKGAIKLNRSSA